jgi:hypothetical protein
MTTPARKAEADRVELVYYWALNRLGNSLAVDSRELWDRHVAKSGEVLSLAEFLSKSKNLLRGFRSEGHDLAIAYYRLVRALRTGATVALPKDKGETSLEQLRIEFEDIVDNIEAETADDDLFITGDEEADFEIEAPDYEPGDDDDVILVEDVGDIAELIVQANEDAESQADEVLQTLGIKNLEKKLKRLDKKPKIQKVKGNDKVKDEREKARDDAGNRQAAAAMRIMLNAARGLVYDLSLTDQRILGWVRYSQSGKPCGFCAMLMSRGHVLYRTRKTAILKGGEGDPFGDTNKYHDNCRCVAIPIFSITQYDESSLFERNREYKRLWNENIKGQYGGKDALNAWRTMLRKMQSDNDNEPAQAAA